jgi:D-amino-acid dehydrogenase
MRVIVLGAGVMGVLSAYFLNKLGCEVVVVERHPKAAMETSFSNGAQLSYSHMEPWSSFSMLRKVFKWLGQEDAPILMHPTELDADLLKWMIDFLRNCPQERFEHNSLEMLAISLRSRQVMHEILIAEDIDFHYNKCGILHIYNTQEFLDEMKHQFDFQRQHSNFEYKYMDPDQCLEQEPALEHIHKTLCGGIFCHMDEVGDIHEFSINLAELLADRGVDFYYDTKISNISVENGVVTGVGTSQGFLQGDSYLVALGAYSGVMLQSIGIEIPIYPLKGYSITIPTGEGYLPPNSITHQDRKIVFSRLGDKLRVSGTAEFAGFDHSIPETRIEPIVQATRECFPNAGDFSQVEPWSCLRAQMPNCVPVYGKTKYENLFLNSGHGSLGWTMGAATSKDVAEEMVQVILD